MSRKTYQFFTMWTAPNLAGRFCWENTLQQNLHCLASWESCVSSLSQLVIAFFDFKCFWLQGSGFFVFYACHTFVSWNEAFIAYLLSGSFGNRLLLNIFSLNFDWHCPFAGDRSRMARVVKLRGLIETHCGLQSLIYSWWDLNQKSMGA